MNQDALKQPFFAGFLESQKRIPAPGDQRIPWPPITPPTSPLKDHHDETMKYPSDGDEEGTQV
jgi:hypothetical protein